MDNIPGNKRTTSTWPIDPVIQDAVDKLVAKDPDAYKRAQNFGDFLMSSRFANVDNFKVSTADDEGDKILYNKLMNDIRFYGLSEECLEPNEKQLLEKFLGKDWSEHIAKMNK